MPDFDLEYFEANLAERIGRPTRRGERPFICSGSPLECTVFIVGCNPATELSADFWDFWKPGAGFDRETWFKHYQQERMARRKRPISPTRQRIEWIIEEATSVRCLETNVYAIPTEEAKELPPGGRGTNVFEYLLDTIKPSVIVIHGNDAKEAFDRIKAGGETSGARLIAGPHFIYWSEDRARVLGRRLRTGG